MGAQKSRGGSPFPLHLKGGGEGLEGGARGPTGNSRQASLACPSYYLHSTSPPQATRLSTTLEACILARVGERDFGELEGSRWESFLFHP